MLTERREWAIDQESPMPARFSDLDECFQTEVFQRYFTARPAPATGSYEPPSLKRVREAEYIPKPLLDIAQVDCNDNFIRNLRWGDVRPGDWVKVVCTPKFFKSRHFRSMEFHILGLFVYGPVMVRVSLHRKSIHADTTLTKETSNKRSAEIQLSPIKTPKKGSLAKLRGYSSREDGEIL